MEGKGIKIFRTLWKETQKFFGEPTGKQIVVNPAKTLQIGQQFKRVTAVENFAALLDETLRSRKLGSTVKAF